MDTEKSLPQDAMEVPDTATTDDTPANMSTDPTDINPAAEPTEAPEKKPKRIRKKKKPKDALAPKFALSGYNFFMRECRPSVLERNPDANIQEITRKVALEWGALNEEQKRPYLERAEVEKKRYALEMGEYKKMKAEAAAAEADLESSRVTVERDEDTESPSQSKKAKSGDSTKATPTPEVENNIARPPMMTNGGRINGGSTSMTTGTQERGQSFNELLRKRPGDYDIPIFTDDFLEHNKALDSELRTLRKSQTDYEQQNSILEKHVENMQNGVDKLSGETVSLKETNRVLANYLSRLRMKLVESLSGLSIPSHSQGASLDNIEQYMSDLQNMVTNNSHGPASLNKAKDIIRKADLQLQ